MVQKALMYNATMYRLKFFSQSTLLFNNLVLTSYLSGVLLRIMVFLVMGMSPENIKEKKETDRRKTLKSEEKEKRRTWRESNNNDIHLYWFEIIFCSKKHFEKKLFIPFYHEILFSFIYIIFPSRKSNWIYELWKYF